MTSTTTGLPANSFRVSFNLRNDVEAKHQAIIRDVPAAGGYWGIGALSPSCAAPNSNVVGVIASSRRQTALKAAPQPVNGMPSRHSHAHTCRGARHAAGGR
jgi:hypothetical protein